jgi:hypothetical protein
MDAIDVEQMARESFARVDEIRQAIVENEDMLDAMDDEAAIEALMDNANFQYLMQESMEQVYDGCTQTRMQVGIVMYSIISLYSVPNTSLMHY